LTGKEFKRIREKIGLEREDFAKLFGMSGYMAIANIENGSRRAGPTMVVLMRTLDAIPTKRAQEFLDFMRKFGHDS
jgi:transcriptional regulator with XRE-family HTH domain